MEREKTVVILKAIKRLTIKALLAVVLSGIFSFIFSKSILIRLLKNTNMKVYYYTLPEVFFSSVELSLFSGLFFAMPAIVVIIWRELHGIMKLKTIEGFAFSIFTILLFYLGGFFCYFVVLPSGIQFLVGYENEMLKAMISVEKFITFSATMIFAFGVTFEIPIILLLLSKKGILRSQTLTKTRRFAILFIIIASAIITPTPDVYNMMLLAVPTYFLFEVGILLMKINERRQKHC
ncbi:MAG TPA: twin-arginine translocase subunit TatC [Syntrophorhabdaceae bacterium]|nr:twin-arginine translocase subunit TatC [Syntrophorhabdaceae bacterium]